MQLNPGVGIALVRTYDPSRRTDGNGARQSWLMEGLRLDTDAPGSGNSYAQDIDCAGAFFHVVWQDDRGAPAPFAGFDIVLSGNVP